MFEKRHQQMMQAQHSCESSVRPPTPAAFTLQVNRLQGTFLATERHDISWPLQINKSTLLRPPYVDGGAQLIGSPRGLPSTTAEALVHLGHKIILPPTQDLSRRCFHGDTNAGGSRVRCPVKQG
ncbi:unnamed protein product [Arctogadus glacialis]